MNPPRPPTTEAEIRAILAMREPCDPDCPGWFACDEGDIRAAAVACDECRRFSAKDAVTERWITTVLYYDEDIRLLPEARREHLRVTYRNVPEWYDARSVGVRCSPLARRGPLFTSAVNKR